MIDDPDLATLARFVGDVDEFADRWWGRAPLLRRTGADFTDLLDVDRIEAMLLQGGRTPTFRLVQDGAPLDPRRSTTTVRLGGRSVDDVADVHRIADEVSRGATVVLQGLQRTDLRIARLCRSLERATSHPVQANAYLSPAGATGLAAHADDHDVIVVQLEGAKRWTTDGLGAIVTHPGDVVYLPAGEPHAAATQDTMSLHLTIGIVRVTRRDAVRRMLDGVGDLDAPLPLGFARPQRRDELRRALIDSWSAAARALDRLDVAAAAEHEQRRADRRRAPLGAGRLASVLAVGSLTAASRVRAVPDLPVERTSGTDGAVVLEVPSRRISFPGPMAPAIELVLSGVEVPVGDLPGLSGPSQLVLARRLLREGIATTR